MFERRLASLSNLETENSDEQITKLDEECYSTGVINYQGSESNLAAQIGPLKVPNTRLSRHIKRMHVCHVTRVRWV